MMYDTCEYICNTGSTGVCPGTQYCNAVTEHELGCDQVRSGNIFAHSQNKTKNSVEEGSWLAGDAVLMNQNTVHRGWKHNMHNGPDRGKFL